MLGRIGLLRVVIINPQPDPLMGKKYILQPNSTQLKSEHTNFSLD